MTGQLGIKIAYLFYNYKMMNNPEFDSAFQKQLHSMDVDEVVRYWAKLEKTAKSKADLDKVIRYLALHDLYYLLVVVCGRNDLLPCKGRDGYIDNQFWFDRCREVEVERDGYIDLWSREHGKTSIINFGLTLQDIIRDPEVTIGIFSHTRPIAKAFLRTLMREIEGNLMLHRAFPDIFHGKDVRAYAKFSEDDGVVVKRKRNPNESTIEAWGLVDGMPVSKHFKILLYDDIVVQGSVTTPDMIQKTSDALALSYNLGKVGGSKRAAGTHYHFNDAYKTMIERNTFKPRYHPGKKGGTEDGESVLWDEKTHLEKRRAMGPHIYAAQVLLDPKADALLGFKREWLRYYKQMPESSWKKMTRYLIVDPASAKKKSSDRTAIAVIGLNTDGNYYLLDAVRDRLNLTERSARVFELHRKWDIKQPVRYEKYGMQADIEHIQAQMEIINYRFIIQEVSGQVKKEDRIGRLIPLFEQGKFWLPESLYVTDYEKITKNITHEFVEHEYMAFPVGSHDDFLDVLARIQEPDLPLIWPKEEIVKKRHDKMPLHSLSWMGT